MEKTESVSPPAVPRRTSICFRVQSNLSENDDKPQQLVHLYYVIRVVNPKSESADGDDGGRQGVGPTEIKPVFISHCLYGPWFVLGSRIYAMGACSKEEEHYREHCQTTDLFQSFDFTHPPAKRLWLNLPPPPQRLRSFCAAASLNGRHYVFGWSNKRKRFHVVLEGDDDSTDLDEESEENNDAQPWILVFDPTVGIWQAPFGAAPPAFPDSLDSRGPMSAVAWYPRKILFTSPTTDCIDLKFGYDVTDNHWEHVYTENQNLPPAVQPVGEKAIFVNNDTFYYLSGFNGRLYAHEIGDDSYFSLRLEDHLAAKAQDNELDFLHIEDDRFCFLWDNEYNTTNRILLCMQFKLSKVVKADSEQVNGLKCSPELSVLSRDFFLVDNFQSKGKAVWLEGDWNDVHNVEFVSPARDIVTVDLPEESLKIKHSIEEMKRKMREG